MINLHKFCDACSRAHLKLAFYPTDTQTRELMPVAYGWKEVKRYFNCSKSELNNIDFKFIGKNIDRAEIIVYYLDRIYEVRLTKTLFVEGKWTNGD